MDNGLIEFFKEYLDLCKRYKLCLVPLSSGEPNKHDSLCVDWLDYDYVINTSVYQKEYGGDWFGVEDNDN